MNYIYVDGACSNNGNKKYAKSGIGIYFGQNDVRNVSMKLDNSMKQTNNTAELYAMIYLYDIIKDNLDKQFYTIVSDSVYAIRCATTYGKKCNEKKWLEDIPNKEMVKTLYELYSDKSNVKFKYVRAHTGKKDVHSIGNDGADRLARDAIKF
jgi:ribonuclease HI